MPAMTSAQIVDQLKSLGREPYKNILLNHGIVEPVLGVKVEELKKIQKRVKKDHALALELYDTGIYDAQYLAGLIADETKITPKDLRRWLAKASSGAVCAYIVATVAADGPHGWALAREWIDSPDERTAHTGWTTLSGVVGVTDDDELDVPELKRLLKRVGQTIHDQPNLVRYSMNGFVIAVGAYVASLTDAALQTAERIGVVSVDMGRTACNVPHAPSYIQKIIDRGTVGKKRKSARC
jgi:3-methyladenine DNA glycosylase AlkD